MNNALKSGTNGLYPSIPLMSLLKSHDPQDRCFVTVMFEEHCVPPGNMHTITTVIQPLKIAVRRPCPLKTGNMLSHYPAIFFRQQLKKFYDVLFYIQHG